MRVNIYAEEMTNRLEIIGKEIDGHNFTGLRFYLELPATVGGKQYQAPFMHHPGDDDSSAVTFWGKRDLRKVMGAALQLLDKHYDGLPVTTALSPPAIGAYWAGQGGIYAGIMAGRDGTPDYHLIVATPELGELKKVAWGKRGQNVPGAESYHDGHANTRAMLDAGCEIAVKFAALQIDGHTDYYLPSQAEAHLMAANLKEQFDDAWFWTSTQYSAGYAGTQGFSNGVQSSDVKDYEGRARAVRLIQINP